MSGLTLRERVRLRRIQREIADGKRDEMLCDPIERARLEFTGWRLKQGLSCSCGLSEGEKCYCEDDYGPFNYG